MAAKNQCQATETRDHTHCLACGRCLAGNAFCSLRCMLDDVAVTLLRAITTGKPDAEGFIDLPDLQEDWERRTMKADEFERLQALRKETREHRSEQRLAMAFEARDKMRTHLASMATPKRNPKLN
jgi:hypothetical protein